MRDQNLLPEGFTEAVAAAKDFYGLYTRIVVSGCVPMEQLRFVAALKLFDSMLAAAPQPDVQPVAWSVFDKRTKKHWYTNDSKYTAGGYAQEYSHREPDGSPSMLVIPLYTHPPAADVRELVEALTELLGWQTLAPDEVMQAARAAIAKATGEDV